MNILVVDDEKNIAYAIAQILEEQKKSMYDVENIFKKRSYENDIKENEEVKEMLVYKETFFRKFINKIKSFFKIK